MSAAKKVVAVKKVSADELASQILTEAVCKFMNANRRKEPDIKAGGHEGYLAKWVDDMRRAKAGFPPEPDTRYDSFKDVFPMMMEEASDRYAEKHPSCDFLWVEEDGSLLDVTLNLELDEGMIRRLEAKAKKQKTTVRALIEFFVATKMKI